MASQPRASTGSLTAVVADAHHLVRRGLTEVLLGAGMLATQAADADSALGELAARHTDVLLVGLDLPGSDREHIVAIARRRWPDLAIVAMSDRPEQESMLRALELGASAYLPRSAAPERFVSTVHQASAAPKAFLSEDVLAHRRNGLSGPRLTRRESEVLALAAEGLTVREISARLYVSEATTRSHLSGIYRKLGVSTRSQAVLAAERLGMLAG